MRKIILTLLFCAAVAQAAPAKPAPKPAAKPGTAAKKPRQHSKTIKHLEDVLGRKLSDAEKAKVRAAREVYDRDMARAVGLSAAQMEAKDKAYKVAHKDDKDADKDGKP